MSTRRSESWLLVIVSVAEGPDPDVERDEIGEDEHGEEDERRRHCMFPLPPLILVHL